MRHRWQRAIGLFAVVLVIAACVVGGCLLALKPRANDVLADLRPEAVAVRVAPARRGTLTEVIEGLGRVESLPDHVATLTPAVEGHVEALLVRQGDPVRRGQPIIELDKSVAEADLTEKSATRDSLKAALALLQSLPRPEERRPNELAVEQAKVAVARARAIVEKLRPLLARHEVSEQQVFDAEKALEAAILQQQAAEATLHAMIIGPRPEAVSEAEAKIETAEGAVAFSRAHLAFHTIRAPIDGVLDSLTCHPGQTISIGAPVGEVVDTRQLYATVWLPPRAVEWLRLGQDAWVENADGRPSEAETATDSTRGLGGKIESIGRVADPQTGNLPVRVLVENPDGRLVIGQTIRVSIARQEHRDVVQVPVEAINDVGEGPVLGVVRDGKAAMLHPTLGVARGGWVAVLGTDLREGEPVILEGGYNLPEGTPVQMESSPLVARSEVRR
jgi:HlyD family secretion protein